MNLFKLLQEEISKERGLQLSTLGSHLESAFLAGYPVCFSQLGITADMIKEVEDAIRRPPISSGNS